MLKINTDRKVRISHILIALAITISIVAIISLELCTNFISAIVKGGELAKTSETTIGKTATINNATGVKAVYRDELLTEITQTKGNSVEQEENANIYEGEFAKFSIKVTNQTEEDIEGVKVVATIPEGLEYGELTSNFAEIRQPYFYTFYEEIKEKEIELGQIGAGQTKEVFYEVKAKDLPEGIEAKTAITNINTYIGEELSQEYEMKNTIISSDIQMFMGAFTEHGGKQYVLNIKSDTQEKAKVNIHLPQTFNLQFISRDNLKENSEFNTIKSEQGEGRVVWSIASERNNEELENKVEVEISEDNVLTTTLDTNKIYTFFGIVEKEEIERDEKALNTTINAYAEEVESGYISNETRMDIQHQNVEVSINSSNAGAQVKYGEEIDYDISIKNIGTKAPETTDYFPNYVSVNLLDFLPEEINPVSITYDNWKIVEYEDENVENSRLIAEKEEITTDISSTHQDENGNKMANVDVDLIIPQGETANVKIKTTAGIVYEETEIQNKATISGSEMSNKETEAVTHTIHRYDYKEETQEPQPTTPVEPVQPTTPSEPAETVKPTAPTEQKQQEKPVTQNTPQKISNNNQNEKQTFDFKIDKYVSKVTVKTSSGTKEYQYDNQNLVKTEIKAKEINSAVVTVEYKIVVTNVGNTTGTVTRIADKLPAGFAISEESNKSWPRSANGEYVNTSKSNLQIKPGESTTLTIKAIKQMNQDNVGSYKNEATIKTALSADGTLDSNSQNNTSYAEVIISISTGIYVYITIALIALAILITTGAILVKKGKLNIKKISKVTFFIVMLGTIMISNQVTQVEAKTNSHQRTYTFTSPATGPDDPNIYYYWYGGPTGIGYCANERIRTDWTNTVSWGGDYNYTYTKTPIAGTKKELILTKNNDEIEMAENGSSYTFGPFEYTSDRATSFRLEVKDGNGNIVNGWSLVGNLTNGSNSFYLNIPKEKCKNGIVNVQLSTEGQEEQDYTIYESWDAYYYGGGTQPIYVPMHDEDRKTIPSDANKKINWTNIRGALEIEKVDSDDPSVKLANVKFKITGPSIPGEIYETDKDGKIYIENIKPGTYIIEEVETPHYGYKVEVTDNIELLSGQYLQKQEPNIKHTGNLKIRKINEDSKTPLPGFKFIIQNSNNEFIKVKDSTGERKEVIGSVLLEGMEGTTRDNATVFVTDSNGEIGIYNILEGEYNIYEIETGNEYFEVDDNYIFWDGGKGNPMKVTVNRQKSTDTRSIDSTKVDLMTIRNRQKYVDLSGFVWEDITDGKLSLRNGKYKTPDENTADEKDKLLQGVTVNLRTADEIVATRTTDSEGKYEFLKVEIDKLNDLYIEFVYNGMSYQSVAVDAEGLKYESTNTSKATEGAGRQEFNNKFQTITNNNANGSAGDIELNYDKNAEAHTSTLNFEGNPVYGYEGANYPINGVAEKYTITSSTYNAYNGGISNIISPEQIRKSDMTEVENLNLGVYERERPTLAIKKDIDNVKLTINGFNHIYKYGNRFKNGGEYTGEGFNVGVKFGEKYGKMSYSRAIYKADYEYENPIEKSRELQAKITYRIGLVNSSTSLIAQVNSILDYYDARYPSEIIVGTTLNNDGSITDPLTYNEIEAGNNYKGLEIDTSSIGGINPQSEASIYVQFTMSRDQLKDIIKVNEQDAKAPLDNVAEISSYSILDGEQVYAGIDTISNPGNCIPGDETTYEMDTDKAPAMILEVKEESVRKVDGSVFEDKELANMLTERNIRQGDGIYGEGESGIAGVKVTLYTEDASANISEKTTTTDESGNYHFEGYIPGNYKIKFTWGDETYTVQDYKGTIFNKKAHEGTKWYKEETPRYSDAIDDYAIRQEIDKQLTTIRHDTKPTIDKMDSYTPEFAMEVENPRDDDGNNMLITETDDDKYVKTYEVKNIDFGIIRRPIQKVELTKEVAHIKLTLENGQIIVDTDIEDGKTTGVATSTTVLPADVTGRGTIKIELDNEIIQGSVLEATYRIKATNHSEIDYTNEEFYKYGNVPNMEPVAMTKIKVVDYLDSEWVVESENNEQWKKLTEEDLKPDVNSDVINSEETEIKERRILINDNIIPEGTKLKPNAKTNKEPGDSATIEINSIKTLTTANYQDIELSNEAEILEFAKTGGGKIIDITPGNYVPGKGPIELDSDEAERIIITPNLGNNYNFVLPVSITIGALTIIAVGAIVIKKKVIG